MEYDIILADPPWRFNVWSRDTGLGRTADSHYTTMTLKDIAALPVNRIAKENSALFLWATLPMLPEALSVGKAWGFTYATTAFVWAKLNKNWKDSPVTDEASLNNSFRVGMGYYTRANTELVLLFRRGKGLVRKSRAVRQFLAAPAGRHSEKPLEIHRRIEALYGGETTRIELFAREAVDGWRALGNEIDGRDIYTSILEEPFIQPV